MSTIRAFQRQFELEVDKKLTFEAQKRLANSTAFAYNYIMDSWPKYTFFSAANNRISITGRAISRIEPSQRPEKRDALAGKFESVRNSELAKITSVAPRRRDTSFVIGNAVDYAPDVGFQPGQGVAIYQTAMAIARSTMRGES